MNQKLLPIFIALPLLVIAAIFFGRGFLPSAPSPAIEPASASNAATTSDSAAPAVAAVAPVGEQEYPQAIGAVLEQFEQWQAGPIAQRREVLEMKMENAGALSNLTYGNFLLLYLNAQASDKADMSMDWIIYETVAPKLQPIYEEIVATGSAMATFLNGSTPPAEVAEHHTLLAQCINGEVSRSQEMVDVLAGNSTAQIRERAADPCRQVNPSVEAIQAFVGR